ncbi:MAG: hypothetical protein AAGD01_04550 [Acidobacteriota bacterium]
MGSANLDLERRNSGADELGDFSTLTAIEVIVALAGVDVLIEKAISSQPLFAHQPSFYQKLQVAVDRSPRNLHLFLLHLGKQGLRIEVTVVCVDGLEEAHPLPGDSMAVSSEVTEELLSFSFHRCHRHLVEY